MRAEKILVASLAFDLLPCVIERQKPVHIEVFVASSRNEPLKDSMRGLSVARHMLNAEKTEKGARRERVEQNLPTQGRASTRGVRRKSCYIRACGQQKSQPESGWLFCVMVDQRLRFSNFLRVDVGTPTL